MAFWGGRTRRRTTVAIGDVVHLPAVDVARRCRAAACVYRELWGLPPTELPDVPFFVPPTSERAAVHDNLLMGGKRDHTEFAVAWSCWITLVLARNGELVDADGVDHGRAVDARVRAFFSRVGGIGDFAARLSEYTCSPENERGRARPLEELTWAEVEAYLERHIDDEVEARAAELELDADDVATRAQLREFVHELGLKKGERELSAIDTAVEAGNMRFLYGALRAVNISMSTKILGWHTLQQGSVCSSFGSISDNLAVAGSSKCTCDRAIRKSRKRGACSCSWEASRAKRRASHRTALRASIDTRETHRKPDGEKDPEAAKRGADANRAAQRTERTARMTGIRVTAGQTPTSARVATLQCIAASQSKREFPVRVTSRNENVVLHVSRAPVDQGAFGRSLSEDRDNHHLRRAENPQFPAMPIGNNRQKIVIFPSNRLCTLIDTGHPNRATSIFPKLALHIKHLVPTTRPNPYKDAVGGDKGRKPVAEFDPQAIYRQFMKQCGGADGDTEVAQILKASGIDDDSGSDPDFGEAE